MCELNSCFNSFISCFSNKPPDDLGDTLEVEVLRTKQQLILYGASTYKPQE